MHQFNIYCPIYENIKYKKYIPWHTKKNFRIKQKLYTKYIIKK